MKRNCLNHFFLYFMLLGASAASAQNINITVADGARIISNPGMVSRDNNQTYLICNAGQVQVQGNGNTVYVSQNSSVSVDGNNNRVYSVSSSSLSIRGNNNLAYSAGASVTVDGNNNTVHAPAATAVSFIGQNNDRNSIGSLVFTYSGTNSRGCNSVTAITDDATDPVVNVSPNPVSINGTLKLDKSASAPTSSVVIYDVQGRQVRTYPVGSREFAINLIPKGYYTIRFSQGEVLRNVQVMVGL